MTWANHLPQFFFKISIKLSERVIEKSKRGNDCKLIGKEKS